MKKIILFCLISVIIFASQVLAIENQLAGPQILEKVDNVINAPKDQDMRMKLILIDKAGREETRELVMLQKGSEKRVARFVSPASQKGIAFLSLPDDMMYLYLPAFGKTRRIASHVKNTKFAGTDFTYEDMAAVRYSEKWVPELIKKDENGYVLQLKPKKASETNYSKMMMRVNSGNFYPAKIEFYDKGDKLYKVMVREKIEKIEGCWVSKESAMEDLKGGHKTKMILENVKFDSGLSDELFTERYLQR